MGPSALLPSRHGPLERRPLAHDTFLVILQPATAARKQGRKGRCKQGQPGSFELHPGHGCQPSLRVKSSNSYTGPSPSASTQPLPPTSATMR
jgi:hypothetical protein